MAHHHLKTLSEIYTILNKRGVKEEIRMNDEKQMISTEGKKIYQPEQLTIIKSYRFEGDSSPDDNCVLYLIEDNEEKLMTLLDSYGADSNYSGDEFDNFLRGIRVQERSEFDFN